MLTTLEKGFKAASEGYFVHRLPEFKCDAENFAKAADKFENILGNEVVTRGQPDFWKEKYLNFEMWFIGELKACSKK